MLDVTVNGGYGAHDALRPIADITSHTSQSKTASLTAVD